jgi:hypothetical protein
MSTVVKFALAAAVIGLFPFSIVFLLVLEVVMVYRLSVINKRPFNLGEMAVIWAILLAIGGFLQGVIGTIFDFAGPVGWVAKGVIAFLFVLLFGYLVNWYYETENKKLPR